MCVCEVEVWMVSVSLILMYVEAPTAVLYLEILLGRGSKVQVSRNKGGEPSYMRIM